MDMGRTLILRSSNFVRNNQYFYPVIDSNLYINNYISSTSSLRSLHRYESCKCIQSLPYRNFDGRIDSLLSRRFSSIAILDSCCNNHTKRNAANHSYCSLSSMRKIIHSNSIDEISRIAKTHQSVRYFGDTREQSNLFAALSPISILDQNIERKGDDDSNQRNRAVISRKLQNKLSRGLELDEPLQFTARGEGTAELLCDEISDTLNESLSTDDFYKMFKGYKFPNEIIEFVKVTANMDFSHVTVYWDSNSTNGFLFIAKKKYDESSYEKLRHKIFVAISKKLQSREPKFRSILMKDIYFKRVPRLFFLHISQEKKIFIPSNNLLELDAESSEASI